jgi:hypothetical protein
MNGKYWKMNKIQIPQQQHARIFHASHLSWFTVHNHTQPALRAVYIKKNPSLKTNWTSLTPAAVQRRVHLEKSLTHWLHPHNLLACASGVDFPVSSRQCTLPRFSPAGRWTRSSGEQELHLAFHKHGYVVVNNNSCMQFLVIDPSPAFCAIRRVPLWLFTIFVAQIGCKCGGWASCQLSCVRSPRRLRGLAP